MTGRTCPRASEHRPGSQSPDSSGKADVTIQYSNLIANALGHLSLPVEPNRFATASRVCRALADSL
jgi:hypothetical protein